MFSVEPNIVLAPNMMQNAERKHRTQNTNTAHIRLRKKLISKHAINILNVYLQNDCLFVQDLHLF